MCIRDSLKASVNLSTTVHFHPIKSHDVCAVCLQCEQTKQSQCILSKKPGVRQAYLGQPLRQKGQINTITSALLNTGVKLPTGCQPCTEEPGCRLQPRAYCPQGLASGPLSFVLLYQHGEAGQVNTTCYSLCPMVLDTGEPQQCQQFITYTVYTQKLVLDNLHYTACITG